MSAAYPGYEEFSDADTFYERFPQYAKGYSPGRWGPSPKVWGPFPFGSDERAVHDERGRQWMITLVAPEHAFRSPEHYRQERGHATGAVTAHGAAGLHRENEPTILLIVDGIDLYDALQCIDETRPGPAPSLEELTKNLRSGIDQ